MTTAAKVLNAAKGEISSVQKNSPNKYTKWFFGNDTKAPYCAIFVTYVIEKLCGDKTLLAGCTNKAYCPTIAAWAKKKGYAKYSPKKGDLVIFDWECGNGKKDYDHIGFVEKVNSNGTVTTIEGNTSSISNSNGGYVQRRVRELKWCAMFVRLPYTTAKKTTKKKTTKYKGKLPTKTVNTTTGSASQVKLWQKFLNWYGNYGLKVDGDFKTMTMKATKEFQADMGLKVDGSAGAKTLAKAKKFL